MSDSNRIQDLGQDVRVALRGTSRLLWWAAPCLFTVWLFSGTSCIEANQAGFVRRFGAVVRKDIEPGLTFLLPWPIDRLDTVPRKDIRRLESGFSIKTTGDHVPLDPEADGAVPYCLTGDQNIIHISMIAQYQIKTPYLYQYDVEDSVQILRHVLNDAVITSTAGMTIDGVLTTEKELLIARTRKVAQQLLDNLGAGLLIRDLQLETPPTVPEQTEAAFQSVIDAKVGMQTARYRAQEYAKIVRSDAEGYAAQIKAEARSARNARITQANSDAKRFLAVLQEYQINKAITRLRMYLEMMDAVMAKVKRHVLPAGRIGPAKPGAVPPVVRPAP